MTRRGAFFGREVDVVEAVLTSELAKQAADDGFNLLVVVTRAVGQGGLAVATLPPQSPDAIYNALAKVVEVIGAGGADAIDCVCSKCKAKRRAEVH